MAAISIYMYLKYNWCAMWRPHYSVHVVDIFWPFMNIGSLPGSLNMYMVVTQKLDWLIKFNIKRFQFCMCSLLSGVLSFRIYSEPSLQRQNLFPKMLPLKRIFCCEESVMDRMICKKDLVLFLLPHIT